MATGLYRISAPVLIDRELRCRGSSLQAWAAEYGVPLRTLEAILLRATAAPDDLLGALAATLGVTADAVWSLAGDAPATPARVAPLARA